MNTNIISPLADLPAGRYWNLSDLSKEEESEIDKLAPGITSLNDNMGCVAQIFAFLTCALGLLYGDRVLPKNWPYEKIFIVSGAPLIIYLIYVLVRFYTTKRRKKGAYFTDKQVIQIRSGKIWIGDIKKVRDVILEKKGVYTRHNNVTRLIRYAYNIILNYENTQVKFAYMAPLDVAEGFKIMILHYARGLQHSRPVSYPVFYDVPERPTHRLPWIDVPLWVFAILPFLIALFVNARRDMLLQKQYGSIDTITSLKVLRQYESTYKWNDSRRYPIQWRADSILRALTDKEKAKGTANKPLGVMIIQQCDWDTGLLVNVGRENIIKQKLLDIVNEAAKNSYPNESVWFRPVFNNNKGQFFVHISNDSLPGGKTIDTNIFYYTWGYKIQQLSYEYHFIGTLKEFENELQSKFNQRDY